MAAQEAESQRSAPTDTASSDGGSTLDAAARGARSSRLPVDEYAAWMGTYPGMVFKLPTSRGARRVWPHYVYKWRVHLGPASRSPVSKLSTAR